ncbi:MAG: chorismate synthase [Candidatus Omnitrophica bacterium]|nr:chorismate synthase [Candidatus Omnitrophota bacterium]
MEYITCGESHGKQLMAILEGMPSGLRVNTQLLNKELACRQEGYGRGARMNIEKDSISITAGLIKEITTGAPIGLVIPNKDRTIIDLPQLECPRPGHADFAGALKYNQGIREVLERSSARETAVRVAVGGVCKQLLKKFAMGITSHVTQIGKATTKSEMTAEIKKAAAAGDTLGGECELVVKGVPVGLGSYVHYKRKLDATIAQALMSIQAVKVVQFGLGTHYTTIPGSCAHDELFYSKQKGYYRKKNHAGGIEGGMSNGSDIVVRITMKPIATLQKPLPSVNMKTKEGQRASVERSDVCAVQSCGVIGEAVIAFEIAKAFLEKFGGDSITEIERNYKGYLKQIA